MEESRLVRTACAALSSMLIHSEAWTMWMLGSAAAGPARRAQGASQRGAKDLLRADQVDADVVVAAGEDGPANLWLGGLVGTHSIYNDVDRHQEAGRAADDETSDLACFLDCERPRGPCTVRTCGRRGGAACARGSWGTRRC